MNNVCKREGKDRWQHMAVKVSGLERVLVEETVRVVGREGEGLVG